MPTLALPDVEREAAEGGALLFGRRTGPEDMGLPVIRAWNCSRGGKVVPLNAWVSMTNVFLK